MVDSKTLAKVIAPTLRIAPAIDNMTGTLSASIEPAKAGSDKTLPAEFKKPLVSASSCSLRCMVGDCLELK